MTIGSLFDGSGGFPLGGMFAGMETKWSCEVEPFPIRVTTKRFPGVKHYGDVSALSGSEVEPVDIITFGSPCQDMSLAGKREGLDGERSGLFHQAIRIIKEMRKATNGEYPKYAVWENVKGCLSSNKGEDFRRVIEEFCKIKESDISVPRPEKGRWQNAGLVMADDYSIGWRLFDAQYWGVPQRRKRIYLIADFDGLCAGKILFESEGVSGHPFEGFKAWQGTAAGAQGGSGETSNICLNDQGGERMDITEDVTATLRAEAHHPPVVVGSAGFCTEQSADSRSIGYEEEKSPTLRAGVVPAALMFENHSQDTRYTGPLDKSQTVLATFGTGGNNQPLVVQEPKTYDVRFTSDHTEAEEDVANTLVATDYKDPPTVTEEPYYIVRRLTPTECARLQGFPDWWCANLGTENPTDEDIKFWTDVFETHRNVISHSKKPKTKKQIEKWLKNPHTDAAEYKMWGNGVALPNVAFVMSGIAWWEEQKKSLEKKE